jgi:hypothetical protein
MLVLIALVAVALVAAAALVGYSSTRTVRVETGERIVCTYGEVTTDTIHTIEVPAADAAKYKVVRETVICARHQQLETLYAAAQDAIDSGDMAAARAKLVEVIKLEPLFKNAQQQIDAIDAGKTPVVDRSIGPKPGTVTPTPGATPPPPDDSTSSPGKEPVGPVAALSTWVPASLPGYTATPIIADVYVLTREYLPSASAPTSALVVVVEQYKDATYAKAAIKNDLALTYSGSAATLSISGRSVYFGVNGRGRAIVAWNEGGVLVVIEGAVKSGPPVGLKGHLTSLVTEIVK